MGYTGWSLEDSNGKFINNPSESDMKNALDRLGKGIEHYNFTGPGGEWVSAAGADNQIMIIYSDKTGRYESADNSFSIDDTCQIFTSSMNGDFSWKKNYVFNFTGAAAGENASGKGAEEFSASSAQGTSDGRQGGKSLKDEIINAAKGEVANNLGRLVRKGVRGLFKGKF